MKKVNLDFSSITKKIKYKGFGKILNLFLARESKIVIVLITIVFNSYTQVVRIKNNTKLNETSYIFDIICQENKIIHTDLLGVYESDTSFHNSNQLTTETGIFDIEINKKTRDLWGLSKTHVFNITSKQSFDLKLNNVFSGSEVPKKMILNKSEIWIQSDYFVAVLDTIKHLHLKKTLNANGDLVNIEQANIEKLDKINFIFSDNNNRMWIATNKRITVIEFKDGEIAKTRLPMDISMRNFVDMTNLRAKDEYCLTTQDGSVFFLRTGTSQQIMDSFHEFKKTGLKNVKKVFYDSQENNIWLISEKVICLSIIKPSDGDGIQQYSSDAEHPNLFLSEWAYSICLHPKGGVLVGTLRSGLYWFKERSQVAREKLLTKNTIVSLPLTVINSDTEIMQRAFLKASPTKVIQKMPIKKSTEFEIFNFEEDKSYSMNAKLDSAIRAIAMINKHSDLYDVMIHGYASRGGNKNNVAINRIGEVKRQLLKNGIDNAIIKVHNHGEADLADSANPESGRNRRVRIIVQYHE